MIYPLRSARFGKYALFDFKEHIFSKSDLIYRICFSEQPTTSETLYFDWVGFTKYDPSGNIFTSLCSGHPLQLFFKRQNLSFNIPFHLDSLALNTALDSLALNTAEDIVYQHFCSYFKDNSLEDVQLNEITAIIRAIG